MPKKLTVKLPVWVKYGGMTRHPTEYNDAWVHYPYIYFVHEEAVWFIDTVTGDRRFTVKAQICPRS